MMDTKPSHLDLNLLRYLRCLVEEASVSRAAHRMGVTQPAMSACLRRMRAAFGDPILVRSGRAMIPTPRSLEMALIAASLLDTVTRMQDAAGPFQPATAQRSFTLIGSDYVEFAFLPALCRRVQESAPGVALLQRPANPAEAASWMQSGQVDLGIGSLDAPPPALRTRTLLNDDLVCVLRAGHPALRGRLDAEAYAGLAHVVVAPGGIGYLGRPVDEALRSLGLARRVALTLPSYLAVPHVLAATDYVATVPRRIAQSYAQSLALHFMAPPLRLPAFRIAMFWHERVDKDAANRWLRRQIAEVAAELRRKS